MNKILTIKYANPTHPYIQIKYLHMYVCAIQFDFVDVVYLCFFNVIRARQGPLDRLLRL